MFSHLQYLIEAKEMKQKTHEKKSFVISLMKVTFVEKLKEVFNNILVENKYIYQQ